MKKFPFDVPFETIQKNFCWNYHFSAKDHDDVGVLLAKAWKKFQEVKDLSAVERIAGNFPILWFGDMDAYFHSEIRVITVGLNPSNKEFSEPRFFTYIEKMPYHGMPNFDGTTVYETRITGRIPVSHSHWENAEFERIAWAYNNYFHINPFRAYFDCYEKTLRSLGCDVSYAGKKLGNPTAKNTAIHIDLKSPIATDPTWSGLSEWSKKQLASTLFGELIAYLRPDVVLFSTGKWDFLAEIGLGKPDFSYPATFDDNNLLELYQKDGVSYVWGRPNVNPFKMISSTLWNPAFSELRGHLSFNTKPDEGVFWVVPAIPHENLSHFYQIFRFDIMEGVFDFIKCMRDPGHYILSVFDHTQKPHSELWEAVKAKYPEYAEFHYEYFPRGRIWTNEEEKSVVFSRDDFLWESFIEEVKPLFRLKDIAHFPGMKQSEPPESIEPQRED